MFDVVLPYKQHYVTDLTFPTGVPRSRRHKRNCARALESRAGRTRSRAVGPRRRVGVTCTGSSSAKLRHYRYPAFSPRSFVPAAHGTGADACSRRLPPASVVGLHLWFIQGRVAYRTPRGNQCRRLRRDGFLCVICIRDRAAAKRGELARARQLGRIDRFASWSGPQAVQGRLGHRDTPDVSVRPYFPTRCLRSTCP